MFVFIYRSPWLLTSQMQVILWHEDCMILMTSWQTDLRRHLTIFIIGHVSNAGDIMVRRLYDTDDKLTNWSSSALINLHHWWRLKCRWYYGVKIVLILMQADRLIQTDFRRHLSIFITGHVSMAGDIRAWRLYDTGGKLTDWSWSTSVNLHHWSRLKCRWYYGMKIIWYWWQADKLIFVGIGQSSSLLTSRMQVMLWYGDQRLPIP
jgi:hypothetical protein